MLEVRDLSKERKRKKSKIYIIYSAITIHMSLKDTTMGGPIWVLCIVTNTQQHHTLIMADKKMDDFHLSQLYDDSSLSVPNS